MATTRLDGFSVTTAIWNALFSQHTDAGAFIGGTWVPVTHSGTNFAAGVGTWAVSAADQIAYQYVILGKTVHVNVNFSNTDVSSSTPTLRVALSGMTIVGTFLSPIIATDAGTLVQAFMRADSSIANNELQFIKANGANWTIATGTTSVIGGCSFQIA